MDHTPRALRLGQGALSLHKGLLRLESSLDSLRQEDPGQDWDAVAALLSTAKTSSLSALQRVRALLAAPAHDAHELDSVERDLRLALLCLPAPAQAFVRR